MLARFFIDRPIFAWVLSLVIILVGGVAAFTLPIDMYPEITPPTVQVSCSYPGANAQVVADTIAAPLEQQVNGVEGMLYMSSQSTNDGSYVLTVTFEIGTDVNMAQVLVQNRVALATPQLPAQVQLQGISVLKTSPNILFGINLISPDRRYDALFLSNFATIQIQNELARIKGVGQIKIVGIGNYSMRIWVDPFKLASRSLTAIDVVNAMQNQNVQVAAGNVGQQPVPAGQVFQLPMDALGRLNTERQFGDIILKAGQAGVQNNPSSPVVHVRDVAKVEMGAQSYDQFCRLDGEPSTIIAVFQLPGSNALDVANRVKARMEYLKARFPPGLEYKIVYDTTPFITQSIDEVIHTLIEAIFLVAVVVLFFLQDWKAMILPMIDVPVSLVGTFAVLAVLGFSLNNLTLFGLVLAIGIVVDDAIVVLENIERLIGTGMDARTATIQGDGRADRTDHRHHARPVVGLYPERLHPRPHGAVLPAVRGDDRHGRDHFGSQRAHVDAVAGRLHLPHRRDRCARRSKEGGPALVDFRRGRRLRARFGWPPTWPASVCPCPTAPARVGPAGWVCWRPGSSRARSSEG